MNKILMVCLIFTLSACKTPKRDDYTQYQPISSKQVADKKIIFSLNPKKRLELRGLYNYNNIKTDDRAILYDASAGVLGVFVQAAIHANINSSALDAKKLAAQEQSNKVISPLLAVTEKINQHALQVNSEAVLNVDFNTLEAAANPDNIVVNSNPIFYLTQDHTTLILKHILIANQKSKIKNSKKKPRSKPIYSNLIEVISAPLEGDLHIDHLKIENGVKFKELAQQLYTQSIDIALKDFYGKFEKKQKQQTFKIQQGDSTRFERGNQLEQNCNHTILRNLRGWLISYSNNEAICTAHL
jgi:hypothetical protein